MYACISICMHVQYVHTYVSVFVVIFAIVVSSGVVRYFPPNQ